MAEAGSQINARPQVPIWPRWEFRSSLELVRGQPRSLFGICPELVLRTPSTVSVSDLPPAVGACPELPGGTRQVPGSRPGPPAELWRGRGQSFAGRSWTQVLVASLARAPGLHSPGLVPSCLSGNSLQMQRLQGGEASVPGSESPIVGRACVNKGPSQCMGGGSAAPHPPGSGPSSMSLGWERRSPRPSAPSGSTRAPQQPEGGGTEPPGSESGVRRQASEVAGGLS